MEECVFCKIVRGEIPTELVYQDDAIAVFPDIRPQAERHLLFIPKTHVLDLNEVGDEVLLKMKTKLMEMTKDLKSYKVLVNGGTAQEVKHLHVHLIGEVSK